MSTSSNAPKVQTLAITRAGVGYVTREGEVEGNFTLNVRTDSVNDVLASITAQGAIGGVSFASRKDVAEELKLRNLRLNPKDVLRSLCEGKLRGHNVIVTRTDNEVVTGRLLGLDADTVGGKDDQRRVDYLTVSTEVGIKRIAFSLVASVLPTDASVLADLEFYANSVATDESSRELDVRVTGEGKSKVRISYLVPAALWGTKYDLTMEEGGTKAVLTPWAIVHNPLDEALSGVTLRLTTGRPVSFRSDLHQPRIPERSELAQDLQVQAPTMYEAAPVAVAGPAPMRAMASMARGGSRGLESMAFASSSMNESVGADYDSLEAADTQATVEGSGEESEFVLPDVNLPPSGATTLPLTRCTLPASILRIWRVGGAPNPEVAVKITNGDAMVLEKGAVAISVGGKFAGQAVISYTPKGTESYLAFARDQAMKISMSQEDAGTKVVRVGAGDSQNAGYILQEVVQGVGYKFEIRSFHNKAVDLVLEIPRREGYDLAPIEGEGISAKGTTANHWRIAVKIDPKNPVTTFTVRALSARKVNFSVSSLSDAVLSSWVSTGVLGGTLRALLSDFMVAQKALMAANTTAQTVRSELSNVTNQEDSLVTKIQKLGDDSAMAPTKARYAKDLEKLAARIDQLRSQEASTAATVATAREEYQKRLDAISAIAVNTGNGSPEPEARSAGFEVMVG